jgi:tetratricopeptide (TPR) repeat protein
MPSGPQSASAERQWLVRLENGEQKTCRELATLQQWIVAGIVSRETLISRSGKTWKRLGDIPELGQYFVIADEARASRQAKPTGKAAGNVGAGTMLGVGALRPTTNPADEDDLRSTGNFRARPPTPPPPPPAPKANPMAQTELAPSGPIATPRRPPTDPPPTPRKALEPPPGRQTAAWASNDIKATDSMASMPQGPRAGKLSASPDEPAFAGKVRVQPSDRSSFDGRIGVDDDEDFYPPARGSRAGMWIALISLLVIGAAAGAVYMFVFKAKQSPTAQTTKQDAGVAIADGNTVVVAPIIDAQDVTVSPLDSARAELVAGVHTRMKTTLEGLAGKDDPASLAMRARLMTAMAQGMNDRAGFVDKAEADKLRKDAKQIVIDAAPLAQRAQAAQADSVDANLAMADVLRLQGKPAPAVKRYITTAKSKAASDKTAAASVALSEAQLAIRDGKLADATTALSSAEPPADDMRIKLALALIAYAQAKAADAKAQVDQILATQPDHDAALAMYKKLETSVSGSDPLPPEEGSGGKTGGTTPNTTGGGGGGGGDSYDALLAKANKLAESNCTSAMPLYEKALQQKSNGVEALTGAGYCHLDRKEFSSAFSKFRAALLVSPRYEPALGGIAETYGRQGNKPAAIEAWNKYLEVFPGSAKAKKQLELLGADPNGGGTKPPEGGGTGGGTKPPEGSAAPPGGDPKPAGGSDSTPPPAPAPTPAPATP